MPEAAIETPPTQLYLIRHGQAIVNVEPIIGGMKGDRGLTSLGIEQATLLRDRLMDSGEVRPDVLIVSTLPRARHTAEVLAPAFPGVPVEFDDEVQELRSGEAGDGLTIDEYKRRFGWVPFDEEPLRPVDPAGESWASFILRIATALARITRVHAGKTIVVVCHGGVIDASFLYFFGMNGLAFPPAGFATQNTSLTHWEYLHNQGKLRWRLVSYNDATHLKPLGRPRAIEGIDYAETIRKRDLDPSLKPLESVLPAEQDSTGAV
ncbi:MAG: histidine phosphatase family protein [Cytophagales bacterium]|nr:histidine phosphatase family protein [Armatimonadota bacterium]